MGLIHDRTAAVREGSRRRMRSRYSETRFPSRFDTAGRADRASANQTGDHHQVDHNQVWQGRDANDR